jgi:hypothetical protein
MSQLSLKRLIKNTRHQRGQHLPASGLQLPQRVDLRPLAIQIGDNAPLLVETDGNSEDAEVFGTFNLRKVFG